MREVFAIIEIWLNSVSSDEEFDKRIKLFDNELTRIKEERLEVRKDVCESIFSRSDSNYIS